MDAPTGGAQRSPACLQECNRPIACRARAVIAAQSPARMSAAGASHDPPTATTLGNASQSMKFSSPMPPVGQNRACGKGPASARSAASPPAGPAGKNLTMLNPWARAAINSEGVCTPGMNGRSLAAAASSNSAVAPGLKAKRALSARAVSRSSRVNTVPRPRIASGTSLAMADAAASRRGGSQRDLERLQASGNERTRQRHGIFGTLDRQDRDDRRCAQIASSCLPRLSSSRGSIDVMTAAPRHAQTQAASRPAWQSTE